MFPNYEYADLPPLEMAIFTWKMRNVLKRMKNPFSIFFNYVRFCSQFQASLLNDRPKIKFSQKWSNLHERSVIGWIERKIQISDFYFLSFSHFCSKNCQFSMNFHDNSKNKNWKIVFSSVLAHCESFMKVGSKLRGKGRESAYP